MATREQQRLETKHKIINAISKLTAIHGIENLKVREICKEADISIGTFYNYYDSIESIIVDAISSYQETNIQTLKLLLNGDDEVRNIELFLRQQVSAFRNVPYSYKKEIFRVFIVHPEIKIVEVNRTNYDMINSMITRGQEKGQITLGMDADSMTKLILKVLIGNCFVNCMRPENYEFADQLVAEVMMIVKKH